jgi:hypothetical protein
MKRNHRRAWVPALFILLMVFSCSGYIVLAAEPDCVGGDCAACAHIHLCIGMLRSLGSAYALLLTGVIISGMTRLRVLRAGDEAIAPGTPVLLKVRRNI